MNTKPTTQTPPLPPLPAPTGSARGWGTLCAMGAIQWAGVPFALGWGSNTKLFGLLIGAILVGVAYSKLWEAQNAELSDRRENPKA